MSKPLSSTALAAGIFVLLSIGTPNAQAKQQCHAAMPPNHHSYWSYRIIDERKCWYEGKPGLSKSLLEWPAEDAKEERKQEPRQELKQELSREPKQTLKQEPKPEPKQLLAPEPKQALAREPKPVLEREPKLETKQEAKQEKEAQKEEAFARPAFRTKRESVAAETPRDPLDAQAFAPDAPETFEALWRSRAQSFR